MSDDAAETEVSPFSPLAPRDAQDAYLYELLHRGHKGDRAFYARMCTGAARVLELGTGYGRLLDALSRVAGDVVGLELHPGLRARAARLVASLPPRRRSRVHIVGGDMRGPLPQGPFDRILIPFNGLFCLLSEADQRACLDAARAVASPDARLVLDAYVIDEESLGDGPPDEMEHVLTILAPEGRYDVFEQNEELPDQRIDVRYRLDLRHDDGTQSALNHAVGHRYLFPRQLPGLLAECGWTMTERHGSFRGARFTEDSGLMIVQCAATGSLAADVAR